MTFLAPTALIGALLLAIPILVHLFKPRKMRRTPFSSLRWLKQTHQRLSRRIQWHQWLLFLMRAGVIVLLVLALAKPLVGSRSAERATDRFIILDVGRSMAYQRTDGTTPLARAQSVAGQLVERSRPGDRTALLLAGGAPRIITPPVADPWQGLPALRSASAEGAEQSLTSILPLVNAMCSDDERAVELVFLTDQRRRGWRQDEIQNFLKERDAKVRVQIVDAGPGAVQNAWIAGVRVFDFGPADGRLLRVELGCVGDGKQERSLRLAGVSDLTSETRDVTLTPESMTRVDFKIPASVNVTGQVAEFRLDPPDALPSDDRWFVNLDATWGQRIVLIEPADIEPGRGPGLHLRAGLEALAEANNHAIQLVNRTGKNVAPADLRDANLVLLAGVPELPDAVLEALEQRVHAGAGMVVFLGDGLSASFYQQKLYRTLQPTDGLLFAPFDAKEPWRTGGAGLLTNLRWSHPLFAPLRDPVLGDMQQVRFRKHTAWASAPGSNDTVLARIDGEEPALVERALGAGRVLVWNTSADDAWSDLPRRRAFVPLLDRMISYLTGGALRREFTVGEPAALPLSKEASDEVPVIATPSGGSVTARVARQGEQTFLHVDQLAEAGAYRFEKNDAKLVFTANASRAGSPLTPIDGKTLEAWWAPAPVEIVSIETLLQGGSGSGAWPLWPALILLAGLLLLAETIYVYRLCPRSDPAVVESIVPKRSVLQPLSDTES